MRFYPVLYRFITLISLCFFGQESFAQNFSFERDYDSLLKKHIRIGVKDKIRTSLVDYESWGKDPDHKKAMSSLLQEASRLMVGDRKKAFWINAYNLLTIDLIIKTNEKKSIRNLGSFLKNPWKSHSWKIRGKEYNLDIIEHDILRKMGDPRIHTAINCASLSCPDLRNEPYSFLGIDNQLDEQAKAFLDNRTKGVYITHEGELRISRIFKWFEDDFSGSDGVKGFIKKYKPNLADKKIERYLNYNWDLNSKLENFDDS